MATKVKENDEADVERDGATDGPLLDLSDDAVKKMIKAAKKRGYVTMDELNSVLPSEEVTSEQIEDTMAMLSDMGINVVEDEDIDEQATADDDDSESDGESEGGELAPSAGTQLATAKKKEPTDRTDDPVRMYLREMGSVELLSREGEIAIAKRIEAGRETMISGLCESPLTFQALIIWRDELNEGSTLLREIIDLETTYSGPEAKAAPQFQSPEKIEADRKAAEEKEKTRRPRMPAPGEDDITDIGEAMPVEEEEELMERLHHHGGDLEHKGRIDMANMSGHDDERLMQMLTNHFTYTGSAKARAILDNWADYRTKFVKVMPVEYRRALREMEQARTLQAAE